MKQSTIPLPDPVYMIELRPSRHSSVMLAATRIAIWVAPTIGVELALMYVHGPHPEWLTLLATFTVLAVLVLLVGVTVKGDES